MGVQFSEAYIDPIKMETINFEAIFAINLHTKISVNMWDRKGCIVKKINEPLEINNLQATISGQSQNAGQRIAIIAGC